MGRASGFTACDRLRERRMLSVLSLEDLATKAGVSVSYVSKIERGERRATPAMAQKLAKALGYKSLRAAVEDGAFTLHLDLPTPA